jgi:hypothetical protein
MNSVDTAYVFGFSQGLTRRFQFVYVGVPEESQLPDEMLSAIMQAGEWFATSYEGVAATDVDSVRESAENFRSSDELQAVLPTFEKFIQFVRYPDPKTQRPGWPVGTAQVTDVMRQLRLRYSPGHSLSNGLDLAIADRIVPQMGNLMRDQLEAVEKWSGSEADVVLTHTRSALQQLLDAQSTNFS